MHLSPKIASILGIGLAAALTMTACGEQETLGNPNLDEAVSAQSETTEDANSAGAVEGQQSTAESEAPGQSAGLAASGELFDSLVPIMEALDAGGLPCSDPEPFEYNDILEIRECVAYDGPVLTRHPSAAEAAEQGLFEAEIGFESTGRTNAWLQVENVVVYCDDRIERCELAQSVLGGEVSTFSG